MTTPQNALDALELINRRRTFHEGVAHDERGEGYPQIFEILNTVETALKQSSAEVVTVEEVVNKVYPEGMIGIAGVRDVVARVSKYYKIIRSEK